jgi:flagellar biosynthetic protein FlhB
MKEFLETYYRGRPVIGGFAFDLQLFAAEDEGRTEEPTEKKLREAREKGQVAKTQELPQSLVVISGIMMIFMLSSWFYNSISAITKYYLSHFSRMHITQRSVMVDFFAVGGQCVKLLAPVFAVVIIAAIVGNAVQVGFQVSTHPLKMDWTKIKFDPATIMKKMFFSKQVAMNLFKSIFKVLAIGFVSYLVISSEFDQMLATPDISIALAMKLILVAGLKIIIWATVILLVLSIPDYFLQRQEFMESLKMTKQELKEEYKESQGDPHLKARLREMQRNLVMRNMVNEVPRADVVVTNPTHFAVALLYDRDAMEAPQVIAKGADSIALRIRQIASENGVPMIENRPLAQQLYRDIEVGDMIPAELFYAVSLIYAELYKKHKDYQEAI